MATAETDALTVDYRYTQVGPRQPGAQIWHYDARRSADSEPIGHGEAVLVDLYGPDPYGSLDGLSQAWPIRTAVMDSRTRELSPTWGLDLDMCGDRLLILTRLSLAPAEESDATLAAAIVEHAITHLGTGAVAAVYIPGHDDLPGQAALHENGRDAKPIRDGVYYLDPTQPPASPNSRVRIAGAINS